MIGLAVALTTLAISGGPAPKASLASPDSLDRAVRAQAAEEARQTARITRDAVGGFAIELTVTPDDDARFQPDYAAAGKTVRGLGVPRGGQSGSPSFDTLTQTYWWED